MKVLICGSRYYRNYKRIFDFMRSLDKDTTIISGACRGADTLAVLVAKRLGLHFREYPANWARYGKKAGVLRNQQMIDLELPDLVVAFHSDIDNSKGTKDMVRRARNQGIQVIIIL